MTLIRKAGRRKVSLILLGLMLVTAAVSYGFVWHAAMTEQEEYRLMIYNISKAMGETEGCYY